MRISKLRFNRLAALFALMGAACTPLREPAGESGAARANALAAARLEAFAAARGAEGFYQHADDLSDLHKAARSGDSEAFKNLYAAHYVKIARAVAGGATPSAAQARWRIADDAPSDDAFRKAAEAALASGGSLRALAALEPSHDEFTALRAQLELETDAARKDILRLNLERWRWMPRDLGRDYILVNVPSMELILVRGGAVADRRRVIVGAPSTPTFQFSSTATGVAFNPVWYVPESIVSDRIGLLMRDDPDRARAQGYYLAADGGVRQRPGPFNALGRMKLIMPNGFSTFLHDTPSKELFARENRALSSGCIRVENAVAFASLLLEAQMSPEEISAILATEETRAIDFGAALKVYIGYFTAFTDETGEVSFYDDIYGLDNSLLSAPRAPE